MTAVIFILHGPRSLLHYRISLALPLAPLLLALYAISCVVISKIHFIMVRGLGGVFIKFGQLLATRPDIIGQNNALILLALQDRVPPMSQRCVEKILKGYFSSRAKDAFMQFDMTPIASASIAQVHRATLREGSIVAVKIMRTGIAKRIAQDLLILRFLCKILGLYRPFRDGGINDLAKELEMCINRELDFGMEAAHMDEFSQKVASKIDYILIPKVHWRYCTTDIIVTEWVDGVGLSNVAYVMNLPIEERRCIAERLLRFYLYQVYECGFFHADLHQGNILILPDGMIALVDFGAVGRLNDQEKRYITMILYAFTKKDYDAVARIHHEAGYISDSVDLNEFATSCRIMGELFIGLAARDVKAGFVLSELLLVAKRFGMRVQPQLLLFQKSLVMIEGVLFYLDESINTWLIVEPWLEQWLIRNTTFAGIFVRTLIHIADRLFSIVNKS